jgi:putrescine transport system substrate-binding protein
VLNYLGKDPNSTKADDYTGPATDLLLKLRPNIRYIDAVLRLFGPIRRLPNIARPADSDANIAVCQVIDISFFDVFAMPADAKNKDEAYQFLNYLLRPEVIAHISDHVYYANANKEATPLVSADIQQVRPLQARRTGPDGVIFRFSLWSTRGCARGQSSDPAP